MIFFLSFVKLKYRRGFKKTNWAGKTKLKTNERNKFNCHCIKNFLRDKHYVS